MSAEFVPNLAPDILQDVKVIVLNFSLRKNGADGVEVSLPMINVKRLEIEPEFFQVSVVPNLMDLLS